MSSKRRVKHSVEQILRRQRSGYPRQRKQREQARDQIHRPKS